MTVPVLDITNLTLEFKSYLQTTRVLHGIDLNIQAGERVGLVGESGSGKSVIARIILGILQELTNARIKGDLAFEGTDLDLLPQRDRHALRGTKMAMIFQDPTSSLNPVYKVGYQFREVLRRKSPTLRSEEARDIARRWLHSVSIADADRVLDSYAFQLSGGMNQRIMIAMALANEPSLLIADEPGTALDVTVQAQTLKLMQDLVEEHGTSVLFISHNLGVIREFVDRVYVIYKGRIVEKGATEALFENPQHPYTQALLSAVPRITGSGISEIDEDTSRFLEPMIDHDHPPETTHG